MATVQSVLGSDRAWDVSARRALEGAATIRKVPMTASDPIPTRRHLLRGAAWVAPVAAVAVAAPAVAASSAPLLGGILTVSSSTGPAGTTNRRQTITINGSAEYPTAGIWMENVPASPNPTAARYTLYLPSPTHAALTWTRVGTDSTWTIPTVDSGAPAISGYTAYTTTYSNPAIVTSWARDNNLRRIYATGRPHFQAVRSVGSNATVPALTVYSLRRVTYNGRDYTLQRGPSTLAPTP